MRRTVVVLALILVLLASASAQAYRWIHIPYSHEEYPVYEVEFGDGKVFVGAEAGVFHGFGMAGGWQAMGPDYPGLGAYSIAYRDGAGWVKETINELALPGATGVGVGNLRGNDYPEIVVAAKEISDAVVYFENPLPAPPGAFWPMVDVDPVADGAREVYVADLDGDYDLDVAVAVRDENRIIWCENTPDNPTDPWPTHEVGVLGGPRGVYVARINGDARPDIVAGGMNDNTVMWFEAPDDPTGPWTGHVVDTDLAAVKGVFACDVDLDGDMDIVAAGREAGAVVWYEQGDFVDPPVWTKHFVDADLPGAVSVWCGNLDADPAPEIAATSKYNGWVTVYDRTDDTDVWLRNIIDDDLPEACPIAAADFDGDGLTDLVAAGREAQTVAWYRSPGDAALYWHKQVVDAAAGHSMGITTGDLDNDGDADIVATACPEGAVTVYWNDQRDILCAFSDGSGYCESDGIYRWGEIDQTWQPVFWCSRPYFIEQHPIFPEWFVCGSRLGLFASNDLLEWYQLGVGCLPVAVRCIWFHPFDGAIMLAGTDEGIYRTTDFGEHWVPVDPDVLPLPVHDIESASRPVGPPGEFVFAALGNGSSTDGVFRSDDLGASWQRVIPLPNPTELLQDFSHDDPEEVVIFVGMAERGIYRIDARGTFLGTLNFELPNLSVNRLRWDPYIDTPAIFGGTMGGLYECLLLDDTAVQIEAPSVAGLCLPSPNPSQGLVKFSMSNLAAGDPVRLSVYDLAGREIWSREGTGGDGGPLVLQWNGLDAQGRSLPSGVYYYRVEGAGPAYTGKVVRVK